MTKRYFAYFDYLGFKDFIESNDIDKIEEGLYNIFLPMQKNLSGEEFKEVSGGFIPDLSKAKINCYNFSDTVIFFTDDNSLESFKNLLNVVANFNIQTNLYFFPARGCLYFDEVRIFNYSHESISKNIYAINSLIGKGLIQAYLKAESQDWAGCVIDNSIFQGENSKEIEEYIKEFAIKFSVPYKFQTEKKKEWVFKLINGKLTEETIKNFFDTITENFHRWKKTPLPQSAKRKLDNTLNFLKAHERV